LTAQKTNTGTYLLTWNVPASVQSYRIKYSDKKIVEWLNFDPIKNEFGGDPNVNTPWFSASEVANPPAPVSSGAVQSFEVRGLRSDVPLYFGLKAYVLNK
jgi:hypothetical protein